MKTGQKSVTKRRSKPISPADGTLVAKTDVPAAASGPEEEDSWFDEGIEDSDTIPTTPLDLPAPTPTVQKSEPEPSPAVEEATPRRYVVLDTPTTNRRPLDDLRGHLKAQRGHITYRYRVTEDRVPSKMLSVNVINLKFD
jgi:hypothetical protein